MEDIEESATDAAVAVDGGVPAASEQTPTDAAAPSWALDWGRLLRTARQVAGLSLTELSATTGLSKGYLSKMESGVAGAANPSRATLAALARALPSFRPLAHTLEPGLGAAALDYGPRLPPPQVAHPLPSAVDGGVAPEPDPIQLGWRELELLAALMAVDAAAVPVPLTAPVLARATGREAHEVVATLGHLVAQGVVVMERPGYHHAVATYRSAADLPARVGVSRLGDLLVLAAALIAGNPANTQAAPRPAHRIVEEASR